MLLHLRVTIGSSDVTTNDEVSPSSLFQYIYITIFNRTIYKVQRKLPGFFLTCGFRASRHLDHLENPFFESLPRLRGSAICWIIHDEQERLAGM